MSCCMLGDFFKGLFSNNNKKDLKQKIEIPKPEIIKNSVGIIIGHNASNQGAINYKGESEFSFNSRIASGLKEIINRTPDLNCKVYTRKSYLPFKEQIQDVAKSVEMDGCKFTIELHFNAGPIGSRGCEILAHSKNKEAIRIADAITDQIEYTYSINQRSTDGVKEVNEGDRGSENIIELEKHGVKIPLLIEPCFSHEYSDSKKIFENEDLYIKTLVKEIIYYSREIIKDKL